MTALHANLPCDKNEYVFTSESVSEGHPDKVSDQISDAILDAFLKRDPYSKVACETLCTKDFVLLSGETSSPSHVSFEVEPLVRSIIKEIGYVHPGKGFDHNCKIVNLLHDQETELRENTGAGDQGLMFGYACSQTHQLMPSPIVMAHNLLLKMSQLRKDGTIPQILPDSKSQVSMRYCGRKPMALETVVISTHHQPLSDAQFKDLKAAIQELVIVPVVQEMERDSMCSFCSGDYEVKINPLGMWEDGGPAADTGLTGRKIIVDTYGGWAQHGGGAFSGKDASKVDRSAAYMARHIAKSIVASGLAEECLIQFSFVIGEHEPVSLMVETFGSGEMPDSQIEKRVKASFDLTVKGIIDYLDLRRAIYLPTASYGHFGRSEDIFSWEKIKKLV
ncbi:MAG: methionine adenosyltransferase [Candidatus Cloacimonetes bacterium]|nr:methionine adenosyltransferase [Candidatus Cloacimonadota bacterium]NLO10880.1 methionine adenosyltransferase [Candidatus Cloacimonadota bacterium]